jgi:lipoyl synthase
VVDAVQAARGSPRANRRRGQTKGPQLIQREDAMLRQREIRQGLVEKRCLYLRFSTSLGHMGDRAAKNVTGGRRRVPNPRNGLPKLTGMPTRSRANPGGNQNVLDILGPDVLPLRSRKPPWFKVPAPGSPKYRELKGLIESENLHTVCQEAACPNIGECWQRGTATFMILGDTCTRRCGFCNVKTGKPTWNDPLEPARVARSVARMGLRHAVITSVDRDDLPDLGASAFVGVIRQIRRQAPRCKVEVLTPDFRGEEMPLAKVVAERPDVFNHNVEVVPRLYPLARRGSKFDRSCRVLRNAKEMAGDEVTTKSGLMVGLGESLDEMIDALGTLRENHVQVLTVGQYLRPTENHLPIVRYWHPDEFKELEQAAYGLGFEHVAAGPLVRSSYHADQHVPQSEAGIGPLAAKAEAGA